jgi:hypothetical protein
VVSDKRHGRAEHVDGILTAQQRKQFALVFLRIGDRIGNDDSFLHHRSLRLTNANIADTAPGTGG